MWTSSALRPPDAGFVLTCGDAFVGGGVGGFASSSDCSIKWYNKKFYLINHFMNEIK